MLQRGCVQLLLAFLLLSTTIRVCAYPVSGVSHALKGKTPVDFEAAEEEYIVIIPSHGPHATEVLNRIKMTPADDCVRRVYNNSAFRGFHARLHGGHVHNLAVMPDVLHVEKSVNIQARSQQTALTRPGSPWGLQRISSASPVSGDDNAVDYTYSYEYATLGRGVDIYIVDTGIDISNAAFGGRARMGFSFEQDTSDQDGHGTHVAGTAGGNYFGVASGANLIGVKVLGSDGAGSSADTIAGMDYVISTHESRRSQPGFVGSIMSMSWGLGSTSSAIDTAIKAALAQGVHTTVAAGNEGTDACTFSPSDLGGSHSGVISVGSVGETAAISSFSNTGSCVDIYAPGENVLSAWNAANNAVNFLSGTSMATPHVTGVMAYLMANDPSLSDNPAALKAKILNLALENVITGNPLSGDTKLLLNNGVTDPTGTEALLGGLG